MNNFDAFKSEQLKETVPAFNVGDTVRVHNLIKEGTRERIQMYEGTVIGKHGGGISETFTVRRVAYGVGVEKTFPLHSPHVVKVDVLRRGKVRRAKLYYLRDRVGKSSKVKELIWPFVFRPSVFRPPGRDPQPRAVTGCAKKTGNGLFSFSGSSLIFIFS